jgi:hypothetical protein
MKVKISSIVGSQIPSFLREESPLLVDFMRQYFVSGEYKGGPFDLIPNIDQYTKLENLTNNIQSSFLTTDISFTDTVITVTSTKGFPESYGLLKIDSEIITYTSKTDTTFNDCVRGFCGTSNYNLEFSTTESSSHLDNAIVENLSVLFLNRFLEKLKKQLIPGFEGREFTDELNQTTFIQRSKDFYATKGTDKAFEILFGALYGEPVQVLKPRDYLFTPSDAEYRVSKDLVVESIFGDPTLLENRTLFQDETEYYNKATGSISKVEKINRGDKTYYIISLDYDFNRNTSEIGEFSIHPKTQLTSSAPIGSTTLDVDSTVGFPQAGSLLLSDNSVLNYTSKSINQFFGCSGISFNLNAGDTVAVNAFAYGYSGQNTSDVVSVRVTGVIGDFEEIVNAYQLNVGDDIRPKSLGKLSNDIRSKTWQYNIPSCYILESIRLLDSLTGQYEVKTIDENSLNAGDIIKIFYKNGTIIRTPIYSKINFNTFIVQGQGELVFSNIDYIEREITRAAATNFPDVSNYLANVQNVYVDSSENYYVSTPSIPGYFQEPLEVNARGIILNGTFNGTVINYTNHGFYTGDVVIYDYTSSNLGIAKGIYYAKKVTKDSISLATSRTNLKAGVFVSVRGTVTNNTLSYNDFFGKTLNHQKLFRKITKPIPTVTPTPTPIGNTGILNNGVEILNYKSQDAVFYGPIDSIVVISPGSDYDVINPPLIEITDETGSEALANCEVTGSLKEIRILNPGLNFNSEPSITISGGNGKNARARAEISLFEHSASFESTSIVNNVIGFSTFHGFNNAEKVIFKPDGLTKVTGITTNSQYFTSTVDAQSIKLHKIYSDAISGINTITLIPSGIANHRIVSASPKTKVSSVNIVDPGEGYKNRKVSVDYRGISIETNIINKGEHNFKTGELIVYEGYTDAPISGLATNRSYYVTAINENSFKLSEVAPKVPDYYFKTGQFVTLTNSGTGTHYFNYEPIIVTIDGISGIGTHFSAKIQPIFRGEITSVLVENGGKKYGQEDILNYNRQPTINFKSGESAQLQAIVTGGKITQVLVINSGVGYNSPPDITIVGSGRGARLTPIIENGEIKEVKVINSGYDYDPRNTYLTVTPAGYGAKIRANIKRWTVNNIERLFQTNKIVDDDGIISKSINSDYGLQYTHGYAPRKLRGILSASKYIAGNLTYQPDLQFVNGTEKVSDSHSPILGWAYDGSPIYGPYGYERQTGGAVKCIESSYQIVIDANRPNLTLYPQGFFVDDYQFKNTGDLDEHNGRYCVTPEFPNGTYAYFSTISNSAYETVGAFANYFKPAFPYFIGNTYHSKVVDFNFIYSSNQDLIDLNGTGWLRNVTPFAFNSKNSFYKYLVQPFSQYEQTSTITSILPGSVEAIIVSEGGDNYKIGDKLLFNSDISGGINAAAEVSSIIGKNVSSISIASTSYYDVEFTPNAQYGIIGFCKEPHLFQNNDVVGISNLSHNQSQLQRVFRISVEGRKFTLNTNLDAPFFTGTITYLNLYGNLNYPNIRENDILQIEDEKIKVLNVDLKSSRLLVERQYAGTLGTSHIAGTEIVEIPRKFFIPTGRQGFTNSPINKEIYFNPTESVGVGIGTTIFFSNPGIGPTSVYVPTRSIYIPEHALTTGEELIYKNNGGSSFSVTSGPLTYPLADGSILYAVAYSGDFVGLSTEKVGVGSTGNYVGYNTTSAAKILYYNNTGTGKKHSLLTSYESTSGQVDKNLVSVFTESVSELLPNDQIIVDVQPQEDQIIKVLYSKETQRLLINPRTFASIDVVDNFITIKNHRYYSGKKIIYTSNSPTIGLENNGIYYTIVVNSDKIGLSRSYYGAVIAREFVELSGSTPGAFSEINPSIDVIGGNSIIFDLSDHSLSEFNGFETVSSFDFDIFTDYHFANKFYTTYETSTFNLTKNGKIGIDPVAKVTLTNDGNLPNELYYNLISKTGQTVYTDKEYNNNYNKINFVESSYSGSYVVSGVGTTAFSYTIPNIPEKSSYNGNVNYITNSSSATGPIDRITVTSGGGGYQFLPGISSVITKNGSNAIFEIVSSSIGRINSVKINDIGYDYPADLTLSPLTQTPLVLKVEPQTTLKSVGIASQGKNYIFPPSLVLLDGLTLKRVPDVDLRYELGDSDVTIFKNSRGINNVDPIIIPTNNSNGIQINSITYNFITKDVTVFLYQGYSNLSDFPFMVGDKVLIENVAIITDPGAKGYNSYSYEYSRFTITQINPNIGGSNGSITYSMADKLSAGEYPGIFNTSVLSGTVVPEKFFPQFTIDLTKNSFLKDEIVTSNNFTGIVQFWNEDNELLTLSSTDDLYPGALISGSDSLSLGTVSKIYNFKSKYNTNSSSIVKKGWNTEKGFFDNEFQRIQDGDYYQSFAYSLKSKIDYGTWKNPVSSLTHIAGFKKFGDFIVESTPSSGINTDQNDSLFNLNISSISEVDLNAIVDYDLGTENNFKVGTDLASNQIYFKNKILQDYSLVVGNRVLVIDDISPKFDGITRQFDLTSRNRNIFLRNFDGSSQSVVEIQNNIIKIPNHYFADGEKVTYSYSGGPIGIQSTNIAGIGVTDKLPSNLYVVKYSESEIALASSAENAIKSKPIPLILSSVGIGSTHILKSTNQNSKAIITLGGIIQSPIVATATSTTINSFVGLGSTTISFQGIGDFASGDYAKIDDEIVKVISVGIASTNSVAVNRAWVGTGIATHAANSTVYKIQGNYNIVDNTIHFVEPPKGPSPMGTVGGSPEDVDYVGITSFLNFNGRVFTRNGIKNTPNDAYYTNFVLDDISSGFNGISSTFTLKSNSQNITGIATDTGSILINEVFQVPSELTGFNRAYNSYTISQTAGISSIRFLGAPATQVNDVNGSGLPIGGVIVSIGYSRGYGIQPLVSAGGTANVSLAGTITSITINNAGSGYRSGLQTVMISAYSPIAGLSTFQNVGIASVLNGNVVSVNLTNPGAGFTFTNPPTIRFDAPLPYVNIPLLSSGIGTGARANLTVGINSSVVDVEIVNRGFGYKKGDILTVAIGGTVGIPSSLIPPPLVGSAITFTFTASGATYVPVPDLISNTRPMQFNPAGGAMNTGAIPNRRNFIYTGLVGNYAPVGNWIPLGQSTGVLGEQRFDYYFDTATSSSTGGTSGLAQVHNWANRFELIFGSFYLDGTESFCGVNNAVSLFTATNTGTAQYINESTSSTPGVSDGGNQNTLNSSTYNIVFGASNKLGTLRYSSFTNVKTDPLSRQSGGTITITTTEDDPPAGPQYSDFKILVDEIYNNEFSGWSFGQLQLIDSIEILFDGNRRSFPLKIDEELRSIRAGYNSLIDINTIFLVFINGILQIPGESYSITGSSFITFSEPPRENYSCAILFYRGSGSNDVIDVDVVETVKPGDLVRLEDDFYYAETDRLVTGVPSSDTVNTITYSGAGVAEDESYTRPIRWRKQTEDLFINQTEVTKNREIYEDIIEPTTNIIKTVGINTNILFVENVRTIFDDERENTVLDYRNKLRIVSQDEVRVAIATVTVSNLGSIVSATPIDGGKGYATSPAISFPIPVGFTTASRAYATAFISSGSISSITINSPGVGYTFTSLPQVMIENPKNIFEDVTAGNYTGDFGLISGIGTSSVGIASTALIFDLFIPQDSFLRNSNIVGTAITVSGIQTGYYFVVKNSHLGNGIKSLDENGSLISTGTTYLDNVYRVSSVSIASTVVSGIGTTSIARVITSVENNNIGIAATNFYGTYSWGRITIPDGVSSDKFTVYTNGISGINTSPIIKRINPLKYKNYT